VQNYALIDAEFVSGYWNGLSAIELVSYAIVRLDSPAFPVTVDLDSGVIATSDNFGWISVSDAPLNFVGASGELLITAPMIECRSGCNFTTTSLAVYTGMRVFDPLTVDSVQIVDGGELWLGKGLNATSVAVIGDGSTLSSRDGVTADSITVGDGASLTADGRGYV
jgi:hypothetical protein